MCATAGAATTTGFLGEEGLVELIGEGLKIAAINAKGNKVNINDNYYKQLY